MNLFVNQSFNSLINCSLNHKGLFALRAPSTLSFSLVSAFLFFFPPISNYRVTFIKAYELEWVRARATNGPLDLRDYIRDLHFARCLKKTIEKQHTHTSKKRAEYEKKTSTFNPLNDSRGN